jgi:hypothetical protein
VRKQFTVIGVDPGVRVAGWIVLRGCDADHLKVIEYGTLKRPSAEDVQRILKTLQRRRPDFVAVEKQFKNRSLLRAEFTWHVLSDMLDLRTVAVASTSWKARFIGKGLRRRKVVDPVTGEKRGLLSAEKVAAKKSSDEAYTMLARERFRMVGAPTDVCAAAWVAAYAVDEELRAAEADG